ARRFVFVMRIGMRPSSARLSPAGSVRNSFPCLTPSDWAARLRVPGYHAPCRNISIIHRKLHTSHKIISCVASNIIGYYQIEKSCADLAESALRQRTLILNVGEWEFQTADPRHALGARKKIISRRVPGNIIFGFASLHYVKAIVLSKIVSAV